MILPATGAAPWANRREGATRGVPGRGDRVLAVAVVALSVFGLVVIYSATRGPGGDPTFAVRQGVSLAIGIVAMGIISRMHPLRMREASGPLLAVTLVALVAVLTPVGTEVRGTQGWFQVAGLSLQPAEPAKVTLVVVVAALLTARHRSIDGGVLVARRFVASILVAVTLGGLVLAGGETGTIAVFAAATLGMYVVGGVPRRFLALLTVSIVACGALLLTSDALAPYQRERLEAFVDVDADPLGAGYNQRQSLTAIGSGGVMGKGLFNGPQTQLRYLPEQQTDFIYAAAAEELGFLGGVAILVLEGLVLGRVLVVSRTAADPFGAIACAGIFSGLAFQVVQNVGMNLGLVPIAGIPLPFVSYGGSSLIATFAALGVVQAVARQRAPGPSATSRTPRSAGYRTLSTVEQRRHHLAGRGLSCARLMRE